jgi:hypothetical protein
LDYPVRGQASRRSAPFIDLKAAIFDFQRLKLDRTLTSDERSAVAALAGRATPRGRRR